MDIIKQRLQEERPLMQFILGPRQVGKTTGIEAALKNYPSSVHYVLVEDEPIHNREWLKKEWWYANSLGEDTLLVLDEIHKVEGWAETIKYLWDETKKQKKKQKCVFLGSSSLNLFHGIRESLAGRFEMISVPHWDYSTSLKLKKDMTWEAFLRVGGYPGSYPFLSDPERWRSYVRSSIVENVLSKDILSINTVKKPALFRQLVELLAAYPAQEVSYTKLLGQLQESGNVEIIKHYLSLLEGAFLFHTLEKYSSKKILMKSSSPKIIPMCPALIEALAPEVDMGRRFESYVGCQLIQLPGKVFYWREGSFEVDFVYKNERGRIFAIEVKSGKKRHSASLTHFLAKVPKAQPLIIDKENVMILRQLLEVA